MTLKIFKQKRIRKQKFTNLLDSISYHREEKSWYSEIEKLNNKHIFNVHRKIKETGGERRTSNGLMNAQGQNKLQVGEKFKLWEKYKVKLLEDAQ